MLDRKEYLILLQNLMNRAVEIELHNAGIENRKTSADGISRALDYVLSLIKTKLIDFSNKNS
jgi:hypothetical protein